LESFRYLYFVRPASDHYAYHDIVPNDPSFEYADKYAVPNQDIAAYLDCTGYAFANSGSDCHPNAFANCNTYSHQYSTCYIYIIANTHANIDQVAGSFPDIYLYSCHQAPDCRYRNEL
jgi:hypothetical protein